MFIFLKEAFFRLMCAIVFCFLLHNIIALHSIQISWENLNKTVKIDASFSFLKNRWQFFVFFN